MYNQFSKFELIPVLLGASLYFNITPIYASMPENEYLRALKIAQSKVTQNLKLSSHLSDRTLSLQNKLLGRNYRVGDQWEVSTWHTEKPIMRMTNAAKHVEPLKLKQGIFRYQVIEVKDKPRFEVKLKITPLQTPGLSLIDPSVSYIELSLNEQFEEINKVFYFKNQSPSRPQRVEVHSSDLKGSLSRLELIPLSIPSLTLTEPTHHTANLTDSLTAELAMPQAIQDYANNAGVDMNSDQITHFEADDFFGRPTQILWKKGDPWPTYMKVPSGISVLTKKETL